VTNIFILFFRKEVFPVFGELDKDMVPTVHIYCIQRVEAIAPLIGGDSSGRG